MLFLYSTQSSPAECRPKFEKRPLINFKVSRTQKLVRKLNNSKLLANKNVFFKNTELSDTYR